MLNSNLQQLIRCTKPHDKIIFMTQNTIHISETLIIVHDLEFVTAKNSPSIDSPREVGMTTIACPKSGPVLMVNTSSFKATGFSIVGCSSASGHGAIVIRRQSNVIFKHLDVKDNRNTGLYLKRNSHVTLIDALLEGNQASENGGAIHVIDKAVINIVNSTIKGNKANSGLGGGIFLGDRVVAFMANCIVTGKSMSQSTKQIALWIYIIIWIYR
eukprot:g7731.t1